jgi:hypothetical protein
LIRCNNGEFSEEGRYAVMRRSTCLLVAAWLIAVLTGPSVARVSHTEQEKLSGLMGERLDIGHTAAVEDSFFNDLYIGALWFPSISNKGYIGYSQVSGFYPGGGDQSTVWHGGMWAGGYVEGGSHAWIYEGAYGTWQSDPARYDTLNEQATVETESDLDLPYPYRRLTVHVNTADKPYDVAGADTLDGDMGMDVTYEWHQWGVTGLDHWVFVHVRIEFTRDIDDFYWAWLSDCDVGDLNVPDWYYDDYAGFNEEYRFCYMRDWDYDPVIGQPPAGSTEDSLFLSPDVIGQYLLAAPPVGGPITADPDTAQKWVTQNYWDWTNDVEQPQEAYDRMAGTWQSQFPSPAPFDYRILNGVGPYDVSAGDTAHFWMAYVVGEGYDEDSHGSYDLGTLLDHVEDARAFFNRGMVIPASVIPPRAPDLNPDLEVDVEGDSITVHWAPYENIPGGATADSFIVYTSTVSKLGPWDNVARFGNSVTQTKLGLATACTYFWVEAFDRDNGIGSNPYALTSRLYERDSSGAIRADETSIVCVISPFAAVTREPRPAGVPIWNYPNPFGPQTTIAYTLSSPAEVRLEIYDVAGRLVRTLVSEPGTPGEHRLSWDGRDLRGIRVSPGIYFIRLEVGGRGTTRTLVRIE